MTFQPGDRVEFTEKAREQFEIYRITTGVVVRVGGRLRPGIIAICRGSKVEEWAESFWQKQPTTTR